MPHGRLVITAGFAMFAMFFGSGNLVFPIAIGTKAMGGHLPAMVGLLLTGVLVPFLGLLGMILHGGNRQSFFKFLGKGPALALTFAMLALLGPFGVVPRCTIVAQGGLELLFDHLTPPLFASFFLLTIFGLAWKPGRIVEIIGLWLTPLLIGTICVLILLGVTYPAPIPTTIAPALDNMFHGLFEGYQTMDLLAAFFFSATTYGFIKKSLPQDSNETQLIRLSFQAALVGAVLLALVYGGFVYMGAKFTNELIALAPEKRIVHVAAIVLGTYAKPIMAIMIVLACLTTALILSSLFSEFIHTQIFNRKVPAHICLLITLSIAFIFTLFGFSDLARWIGFALTYAYPALIAYTIAIIAKHKGFKTHPAYIFWAVLSATILIEFA